MVGLRLDRRLRGRIDSADVLQETYLEVAQRAREYLAQPTISPVLWLRFLTGQKLLEVHRHHLGVRMRDAAQELSLCHRATLQATSVSLAEMLLGRLTSPTRAARRAEMQLRLQELLNTMEPLDREVLAIRHFEELTNGEVAQVRGLSKTAASNRYIRALGRLKGLLEGLPGYLES
jgi:RNA polymerase sigma-70 factor (ECF subfamily)